MEKRKLHPGTAETLGIPYVLAPTLGGTPIKVLVPKNDEQAQLAVANFSENGDFEKFMHSPSLEDAAWVGGQFETERKVGRGFFLLSESFYDRENNIPQTNPSKWLVETLALNIKRYRYYSVIHKMVGPACQAPTREVFWPKVVFYHFVQKPVAGGPRVRPDFSDNTIVPFKKVLAQAQPNFLVVLGKELWRFLVQAGLIQESEQWVGIVQCGDRQIRAIATQHPSGFARISVWRDHILNYSKPN